MVIQVCFSRTAGSCVSNLSRWWDHAKGTFGIIENLPHDGLYIPWHAGPLGGIKTDNGCIKLQRSVKFLFHKTIWRWTTTSSCENLLLVMSSREEGIILLLCWFPISDLYWPHISQWRLKCWNMDLRFSHHCFICCKYISIIVNLLKRPFLHYIIYILSVWNLAFTVVSISTGCELYIMYWDSLTISNTKMFAYNMSAF